MKGKHIAIGASILLIALIIVAGRLFLIRSISVVFEREPAFADEKTIIEASGIEIFDNIFNIDEKEVKAKIEKSYPNNALYITDIERVFPNKVIIKARERRPTLVAEADDGSYIPTDKDFQLTQKVTEVDFDKYIKVSGVSVGTSFNKAEFRLIKDIMYTFSALQFTDEGIVAFIKEIKIGETDITLYTRQNDGALIIGKENVKEKLQAAYSDFIVLLDEGEAVAFTVTKL